MEEDTCHFAAVRLPAQHVAQVVAYSGAGAGSTQEPDGADDATDRFGERLPREDSRGRISGV